MGFAWVSTREHLISNLELSWNASWFDKVAPKNKNKIGNYFVKPRRIPRQLQIADQILCRILKGGATSENPELLNTLCFFPNIPCISLDPKNSSGLEGQGMHISIKHSCLAPSTRLASDTSTCGIFVWDSNRLGKKKGCVVFKSCNASKFPAFHWKSSYTNQACENGTRQNKRSRRHEHIPLVLVLA